MNVVNPLENNAAAAAKPTQPKPAAIWSRNAAVASTLALIVLGAAWELVLAPTGARSLVLKVLPLVVVLPGLLKWRLSTYRWTSLLVWLYAAEGALRAASDRGVGTVLGAIELALALVLFAACAVHVRARLAAGRPA
jgi:uncharacterized membrane protein